MKVKTKYLAGVEQKLAWRSACFSPFQYEGIVQTITRELKTI